MTQINIIGTIAGITGYDSHTRQLARALNKITPIRLSTQIPLGFETQLQDDELEMLKRKPTKDEINLIITHPVFWKMNLSGKRNWVYLVWEGDAIPSHILHECLNPEIEKIIVPSKHTRMAFYKTMNDILNDKEKYEKMIDKIYEAKEKIKVIPHGVDTNLFYPKEVKKEKFTFLCNKGFRNLEDRGGIQYLIRAFVEEFTNKDDVKLIIKINPAYGIPNLLNLFPDLKNKYIPKIEYNTLAVKYDELVNLYNQADVFVSTTRAEAFNLPCIEAMACGLPVITTNFGGQVDYCDSETGWIVGGKLEEVKHELAYEGISWLTPNISEIRAALREAYTQRKEIKKKGIQAHNQAQRYTWDISAEKIKNLI